mmetsp:Transcript_107074/g.149323  ORF Transcript_107074/g.149323 Transcript_107074/m.149323 type:complete len:129 (+) Transcript_107074:42-428(+)
MSRAGIMHRLLLAAMCACLTSRAASIRRDVKQEHEQRVASQQAWAFWAKSDDPSDDDSDVESEDDTGKHFAGEKHAEEKRPTPMCCADQNEYASEPYFTLTRKDGTEGCPKGSRMVHWFPCRNAPWGD